MDPLTIKQISMCLKISEPETRRLLNKSGAGLDEHQDNPDELIPYETVTKLCTDHQGDEIGEKLVEMLSLLAYRPFRPDWL